MLSLDKIKKIKIPKSPGCYQFFNDKDELIYIGKAANLKSRVFSYLPAMRAQAGQAGWQKSANHTGAKLAMLSEIKKIKWIETDSEIEALLLEANLIKKYQPYYNVLLRDDKRFAYIKISLADEIPTVAIARKLDKSGRYFGPYVSALAVRETLKAIRKIWPYCAMRKPQPKPCFYYQINLCTGICGNIIGRREYVEKIIKPIILFLEGKKRSLIKKLEVKSKKLEKEYKNNNNLKAKEELEKLKYQLVNMKKVLQGANILSIGEKYENDVVELAKILELGKIPQRIEGYDISNIFGKEAVGSMVVFSGGEPNKNEYRKFKIKIAQGQANDVRMLREILERRFKRVIKAPLNKGGVGGINEAAISTQDNWPMPDLIIVDGGKAQLNAATSVLKKYKLNITLIAVSKGLPREIPNIWDAKRISRGKGLRSASAPDKLFFPGEKKPLELSLASPALHLIKRVRDEAHRFAIGYHRKLRAKKFLSAE